MNRGAEVDLHLLAFCYNLFRLAGRLDYSIETHCCIKRTRHNQASPALNSAELTAVQIQSDPLAGDRLIHFAAMGFHGTDPGRYFVRQKQEFIINPDHPFIDRTAYHGADAGKGTDLVDPQAEWGT